MLIPTSVLKVTNNERKILTHHEIVDHIAEQIVQRIKIGFIWTYGGQISRLLIHQSSLTFILYIYGPQKWDFVKESMKSFTAIETSTKP